VNLLFFSIDLRFLVCLPGAATLALRRKAEKLPEVERAGLCAMIEKIAVIPLREGSKGLPGKNTLPLVGLPLYLHSVSCAHAAGIKRVIVATDIAALLAAPSPEYELYARSAASSRDDAPTHEVVIEMIEALGLHNAMIVILQATSPLRHPGTVRAALARLAEGEYDLIVSISEIENTALKSGTVSEGLLVPLLTSEMLFQPRQSLPRLFKLDGGVFAFRGGWLVENGSLTTERIGVVSSDPSELLDIDQAEDFERAEAILSALAAQSGA
jgi:N-acylneuraminate cytidylyltransferase